MRVALGVGVVLLAGTPARDCSGMVGDRSTKLACLVTTIVLSPSIMNSGFVNNSFELAFSMEKEKEFDVFFTELNKQNETTILTFLSSKLTNALVNNFNLERSEVVNRRLGSYELVDQGLTGVKAKDSLFQLVRTIPSLLAEQVAKVSSTPIPIPSTVAAARERQKARGGAGGISREMLDILNEPEDESVFTPDDFTDSDDNGPVRMRKGASRGRGKGPKNVRGRARTTTSARDKGTISSTDPQKKASQQYLDQQTMESGPGRRMENTSDFQEPRVPPEASMGTRGPSVHSEQLQRKKRLREPITEDDDSSDQSDHQDLALQVRGLTQLCRQVISRVGTMEQESSNRQGLIRQATKHTKNERDGSPREMTSSQQNRDRNRRRREVDAGLSDSEYMGNDKAQRDTASIGGPRTLCLPCEKRVAPILYEKMMRSGSPLSHVRNFKWKDSGRKYEALHLARTIEYAIDQMGVGALEDFDFLELTLRRLSAIMYVDTTGDWDAVPGLMGVEEEMVENLLIVPEVLQKAKEAASHKRKLQAMVKERVWRGRDYMSDEDRELRQSSHKRDHPRSKEREEGYRGQQRRHYERNSYQKGSQSRDDFQYKGSYRPRK